MLAKRRQKGVSALGVAGALLIVLGVCGLGLHFYQERNARGQVAATEARPMPPPQVVQSAMPQAAQAALPDTAPQPVQAPPASGLNPLWFGVWQGEKAGSRLVISASELVASWTIKHGDGTSEPHEERSKWTPLYEDTAPGDGYLLFGYAKRSKSLAEISNAYEKSVAQFKRDPTDFGISDPLPSRRALAAIKPGNYRVVWTYIGGDCGFHEFIVDGDAMLQMSQCKYGHSVELYTRQK